MTQVFLSNYLLDAAVLTLLAGVAFALLIGPRLKGRRTYNWIVRRVAKVAPGATVTKSGPWLRRSVTATWPAIIGPSDSRAASQLKAVVAPAAPYYVVLMLAHGDEHYLLGNFAWEPWSQPLKKLPEYANLRALKRALSRAVKLHLALKARRKFPSAQAMAAATKQGFLGLDLIEIVGS